MSQKETIKKVLRYIKKYSFFLICSLVLARDHGRTYTVCPNPYR